MAEQIQFARPNLLYISNGETIDTLLQCSCFQRMADQFQIVISSSATVLPILLEGTPLVIVSKQKYLGITIDSNLTWAYQVVNVCKKIASILSIFDQLSSEGTS